MFALIKKEIRYFFTSPIGYTVIGLFVVINGLFLWILHTDYNIFDSGYADMLPFFRLSSWVFVFLIPALTMRCISEEKRSGMLDLLFTKPIGIHHIVLGKYFGILFLLGILLLPSLLYVFMLWTLGNPVGNLDVAGTIGSYTALFLLGSAFAAVGVWASSLSSNQVIAFVLSAFLCFFLFFGLDQTARLLLPESMISIGFQSHFDTISRGVIDSGSVFYFISVIAFFIYATVLSLKSFRA
ncbi:MAG: gliding motility-associated ABC transporter permease subunit GldF [Capnocytophaga sp.]|nr:gliding motility-associated ABC transporter permease subunit GldF [Capnocytophaga sp.]